MRLEDIENTIQYFSRTNMFSVLQMQRESADKAINGFNPDVLLNTPTDDLVKKIVNTYKLDIPVLLRDDAHMDEPREITVSTQDYGRTIHQQGTILVLHVPFTGDAGMFWVQPTSYDSAPPSGNLNGQEMILKMRWCANLCRSCNSQEDNHYASSDFRTLRTRARPRREQLPGNS
jgi:hypothetical protein